MKTTLYRGCNMYNVALGWQRMKVEFGNYKINHWQSILSAWSEKNVHSVHKTRPVVELQTTTQWPSLAWNLINAVSTYHSACITLWMTRWCSTHSFMTRLICWFAAAATNLPADRRLTARAALQPLKKSSQTELWRKFPGRISNSWSCTVSSSQVPSEMGPDLFFFPSFLFSWPLLVNLPTWGSHPVSFLPPLPSRVPQGGQCCLGGCQCLLQHRQATLKRAASRQAGRQTAHTSKRLPAHCCNSGLFPLQKRHTLKMYKCVSDILLPTVSPRNIVSIVDVIMSPFS